MFMNLALLAVEAQPRPEANVLGQIMSDESGDRSLGKHESQDERSHKVKGTVDDVEKPKPGDKEIWRTHHRGQRTGEKALRQLRGRGWKPWTKQKGRQTGEQAGRKNQN